MQAREAQEVDDLCSQLERLAGGIDLKPRIPGDIDYANGTVDEPSGAPEKLAGMWRLVYTSGFNTGSLGGRRPGPPAALVPTTLGQVGGGTYHIIICDHMVVHGVLLICVVLAKV